MEIREPKYIGKAQVDGVWIEVVDLETYELANMDRLEAVGEMNKAKRERDAVLDSVEGPFRICGAPRCDVRFRTHKTNKLYCSRRCQSRATSKAYNDKKRGKDD